MDVRNIQKFLLAYFNISRVVCGTTQHLSWVLGGTKHVEPLQPLRLSGLVRSVLFLQSFSSSVLAKVVRRRVELLGDAGGGAQHFDPPV